MPNASTDPAFGHHAKRPRWTILMGLAICFAGLVLTSLCFGGAPLSLQSVISALLGSPDADPIIRQILFEFRLPRIITALIAGSALAAAGLMMQTLFRNPLADPFVLGINSGASLGVALLLLILTPLSLNLGNEILNGFSFSGQLALVAASTGGAATALFIVLLLSRKVDVMSVLIIGLMMSYTIGAIVSILMYFTLAERLQTFVNWSFGDFGGVEWTSMQVVAPAIALGLLSSLLLVKPLDALLLGERYAESLGVNVKRTRILILLSASLLAGTVTGFCGPIGFLGVAAPHLSRFLFKTSLHRILLPSSILTGAILALASDFVARGPGLDTPLPLNAITALVGAPIILIVLIRQRNSKRLFS